MGILDKLNHKYLKGLGVCKQMSFNESFKNKACSKVFRISARRPDQIIITPYPKKEKTCKIVDFSFPSDNRIKLKECEKKG